MIRKRYNEFGLKRAGYMHQVNIILFKKCYCFILYYFLSKGRWFDETNIKIVVAGLVGPIAVVLFFCFGSN